MMAARDMEMQITDCPVCHEKYSDPKILPCAHVLCRDCLVSWMKTKAEALCPMCRRVFLDARHSKIKNWDVFADSLPTDHALSAMVESLNILSEKHVCHVHNNVDAISLCLHCNVKLCQVCIEAHRKLPTSFHKVVDLATLTPKRLAASRQAPCSDHRDKIAELVCVNHKVLICQLCATTKHRACSEMTHWSEVSGKYKQSLLEMESKLNATESSFSQAITQLEQRLLKFEKSTNAALAKIDSTCDSILIWAETFRKRLKKVVTDKNDKMKAAVHEQKNIIIHKLGRVSSQHRLIKRVLKMGNDNSLVAMMSNFESRVNGLDTRLPQDTNSCLTITLKIDRRLISQLVKELNKILKPIFSFASGTEKNTWMFHNNCGRNITLSRNGQTAEVKDINDHENRVLISREPMSTNKLYEILVEQTDTLYSGKYIRIGVCEEITLSRKLPPVCTKIKTFVGVHASGDTPHCEWMYPCPALRAVKAGSRLGLMVDRSNSLHVYVDGKDQGVVAKNVAEPCYAVFDLLCFLDKVSTLPVLSIR